jgi:methionyl-tRNA formyltransferase
MRIQVLCDNPHSWILPHIEELIEELSKHHDAILRHNEEEVTQGDILLLLSCERVFKKLDLNKFNLVVHESDLPKGKGWSPLTWQILEGRQTIPVTLFEANDKIDSGVIYGQTSIELDGTELVGDLRIKQANATRELILSFLSEYPLVNGKEQIGEPSFYPRRRPEHSQLDINKTIGDQVNLLRVCDNERYPAYFINNGVKYILKIYKEDE